MLKYLSRYGHRTAVGKDRIKSTNPDELVFPGLAKDSGGKRRMRLPTEWFIRRLLLRAVCGAAGVSVIAATWPP